MSSRQQIKFTETTITKDKKRLEEISELINNNPHSPSSELKSILDRTEVTLLSEFFGYKPSLNCTTLYFLCSVGKIDYVKELITKNVKLDGVQEENGGSPIFAAQQVGQVSIVALLLLFGAIPELNVLRPHLLDTTSELSKTGVLAQFMDVYHTYDNFSSIGVGIDFPEEAEFYARRKPQERNSIDGMAVISSHIETKARFRYKKRFAIQIPGLVDSLYASIEYILQTNGVRQNIEEWIQEKKDDIINGFTLTGSMGNTNFATAPVKSPVTKKGSFVTRKIPVLSPIYAVTQRYNINVAIVMYNPQKEKKVLKRVFYVNVHKKNAFPFIYLAYDGNRYEPIVDIPEESTGTTPTEILDAILNPKTTLEHFSGLLDNYDTSKINDLHLLSGRSRTLFYCACRSGRADLVLRMIDIPNLIVTGQQDKDSGSTPLHVASWYGHTDVMIILLYKGADSEAMNNHKEKARLFDEKLPIEKRNTIAKIWKIYDSNDHDQLAHELDAIASRIQVKPNLLDSQPNSPVPKHCTTNDSSPVTLERLCELLKDDTPPNIKVFMDHFSRFDKKFINDFSVREKVTPFYLACRSGSLEIVMEFMDVDGIKLTGQQETRTPEGNTPLHVANWRGHVPIVAYLLTRVEPEPKANGTYPGIEPEIFQGKGTENDIKRTQLAKIFAAAKLPGKEERLRPYWQDIKYPKPIPPIPLSVSLSLPSEEVPPQYLRLQFLWYVKSSKLVLLDLHTSSCLDIEYRKWCEAPPVPDTTEVNVTIYTPPVRGTFVWTAEKWKVNFKQFLANVPGKGRILLYPIKRAQIWYMKSREGPYIPFSNKINISIGEALHKKQPRVKFVFSEGLFIFKKRVTCTVDFQTRQASLSDTEGYFPIINEGEYYNINNWRPDDIKFTERRSVCMQEGEIELNEESEEWKQVSAAFYSTVPQFQVKKGKLVEVNKIVKIKKLFHPTNRDTWDKSYQRTLGYHKDNPIGDFIEYKKILWHGTGSLNPQVIWSTPGNWKPNYSSDKNLWGRGCYFASDAAYSANYAYHDLKKNTKILLLAEVIVGQTIQCMENSAIVDNPPSQYLNCVLGYRHGAWIYVVYEPALAYPVYSVEWQEVVIPSFVI